MMLTYDMNQNQGMPLYEYLYQNIKQDILDGKLKPHDKLPSKRSLADHLNISCNTVSNAYMQLVTEGYLMNKERSGFFVEDISDYIQKPQCKIPVNYLKPENNDYIIDFKANKNGLASFPFSIWSKYMREVISSKNMELLSTIPFNGILELRESIANYLERTRGMLVSPDQIIIGAGTEYLYGRILQMLGPSYTFAFEEPGYSKLTTISHLYGNAWETIPIDQNGLNVTALEKTDADIVHVSPANHFPTGIVMPITRRLELFEWVNKSSRRYIIEDDYDSEFRYQSKLILPLYTDDIMNKVIYMNTFSKTMIPSLRISYMVLPPKMLNLFVETMSFYSCTVSSFEQYALAKFIDDGHLERHINRMKKIYFEQRKQVMQAITKSPLQNICHIVEHNAGTHLLLQINTRLTNSQISNALLEKKMPIPLYSFAKTDSLFSNIPTLILNYAAIEPAKIQLVIDTLCSIFYN